MDGVWALMPAAAVAALIIHLTDLKDKVSVVLSMAAFYLLIIVTALMIWPPNGSTHGNQLSEKFDQGRVEAVAKSD